MAALPQQNHLFLCVCVYNTVLPIYLRLGTIQGLLIGSIVTGRVHEQLHCNLSHYTP